MDKGIHLDEMNITSMSCPSDGGSQLPFCAGTHFLTAMEERNKLSMLGSLFPSCSFTSVFLSGPFGFPSGLTVLLFLDCVLPGKKQDTK